MLNLNYLPLHFTVFLLLGIIFGDIFDFSIDLILTSIITSLLFLIYYYFWSVSSFKPPLFFVIITAFLFVNIGILGITSRDPKYQKTHYIKLIDSENKTVLKIVKVLKHNKAYKRYEANVVQLNGHKTSGRVLINIKKDSIVKPLNVDELLYTTETYREIRGAMNPYAFDYKKYLKQQQIYHQLTLEGANYIRLGNGEWSLKGAAHAIRARINTELRKYNFSAEELSIVNALILGQRQDISNVQFQQYRDAGAIHILAVSGLHIGIILLFLNFLLRPLERLKGGRTVKLIAIIIILWAYAFLAGLSASIVRSVTMFTAIAIGLASNRPTEVKNSLFISLFFLLLFHPHYLFDVGFQLSYTAVFSIVWLQPVFSNFWQPRAKLLKYIWELLTVTFAAQLGILPLTLYYFHQFPGLFFVSSLVIIPFLGLILGLGILVITMALMRILPQFLANIYEMILKIMNHFVALISQQEELVLKNISFTVLLLFAWYLFIVCSISWLKNKTIRNLYFLLIAILSIQISSTFEKYKVQNSNQFVIFHQSKNTVLGLRSGENLTVYYSNDNQNNIPYSPVHSYRNALLNLKIRSGLKIKNILNINSKYILIIDSLGIYNDLDFHPEMVLLINSPKINMERMIQNLHPKTVIADGSNYRSYVRMWEKSCKDKSVRFYNTSVDGAFVYNYTP